MLYGEGEPLRGREGGGKPRLDALVWRVRSLVTDQGKACFPTLRGDEM